MWDQILEKEMEYLRKKREGFLSVLNDQVQKSFKNLTDEKREERVILTYQTAVPQGDLKGLLTKSLSKDLILGRTSVGIHHDDLEIIFEVGALKAVAKNIASQGQARTVSIAIKLAALEILRSNLHRSPILLLDDVDATLDLQRCEYLNFYIKEIPSQTFMTTTNLKKELSENYKDIEIFTLSKGAIVK